jgi:hypothetical protein
VTTAYIHQSVSSFEKRKDIGGFFFTVHLGTGIAQTLVGTPASTVPMELTDASLRTESDSTLGRSGRVRLRGPHICR